MTTRMIPVFDAVYDRRSIRKYTSRPVSKADVLKILDAGRWAPSGKNNQPWRFLVVWPGDARQEALSRCTKYSHIVNEAKALICVLLARDKMYSEVKDHQAAGACIQNMLLAVHALGLGAVWLGEIINQQDQVLGVLGLSETEYEVQAVIAVGHPAQEGQSSRLPLDDLLLEAI